MIAEGKHALVFIRVDESLFLVHFGWRFIVNTRIQKIECEFGRLKLSSD